MRINEIVLGRSVRYPFYRIFDVVQQKVPGKSGLKIRFQRKQRLPSEVLQSGIYAWHHPDWGYFYVGIASKNNFRERWYKHIQKLLDMCTSAKQMRNWKQFSDRFVAAGYGVNDLKDITLRFFPIPPDQGDSPEIFKQKLSAIEDRIVAALNPACNYQHKPDGPSSTRYPTSRISKPNEGVTENFADGKVKGKSRPGRVKRAGASCKGSVTDLRAKARKYDGEKGKMYHWCANMKGGKK